MWYVWSFIPGRLLLFFGNSQAAIFLNLFRVILQEQIPQRPESVEQDGCPNLKPAFEVGGCYKLHKPHIHPWKISTKKSCTNLSLPFHLASLDGFLYHLLIRRTDHSCHSCRWLFHPVFKVAFKISGSKKWWQRLELYHLPKSSKIQNETRQNLGPLLKVKLLVGYM